MAANLNPVVIAHRGASYRFPEHTLKAYQSAVIDADGFECDVRLLRDGNIICWHDATLSRTSNARGLVANQTWEKLQGIDAGSWHRSKTFQPPLIFNDLLELAKQNRKSISIETKHPVPSGGAIEYRLAELLPIISSTNDAARADFRLMSFSLVAVLKWKRLRPDIPAVYLLDKRPLNFLPNCEVIGPGISRVRRDPKLVKSLQARGYQVHVWTVDTAEDIDLCLELGVNAIITNKPDEVRARISG